MEKDIEKLIEQLTKVRPEMLNEEALKLFNTIMAVLDERDELIKRNKELEDRNKTLNESQAIKIKKIQDLEKGVTRLKTKRKELSDQLIDVKVDKITRNFIPKSKIKEILRRLNISNIEPWSTYKVNGEILFDLEKLLGE